jgi:hypothetical protein
MNANNKCDPHYHMNYSYLQLPSPTHTLLIPSNYHHSSLQLGTLQDSGKTDLMAIRVHKF